MTTRRKTLIRIAVAIFVALALAFFAITLVNAWNATNGEIPSLPRFIAAGALWACGLLVGATAWATLLGGDRRVDHGAALLVSQLGKYVPGGIGQVTGQVGLARAAGVRLQRGATVFSVLAVTQVVAGCNYGLLLAATWSHASVFLRVLIAVGAVAVLPLIDRRWMVWALGKIPRTRDASAELVPAQRSILLAWLLSILTLGFASGAYLVLVAGFGPVSNPMLFIGAYAIAWTIGFIAIPIPSGVGIREAVLAFILHGTLTSSVVVAASVYYRLVAIATEGILAAIASHRVHPRRLAAAAAANDESLEDAGTPAEPES